MPDTTTSNLLLYDWNLVSAGCVLTQSVLDSLLLQSLHNPDIVSFWIALLDYHHSAVSTPRQMSSESIAETPAVLHHHRRDSSSISTITLSRFGSVGNSRMFARPISSRSVEGVGSRTNDGASARHGRRQGSTPRGSSLPEPSFTFEEMSLSPLSPLLHLKCPALCVGMTFGAFFTQCVLLHNVIPIGVYRYHNDQLHVDDATGRLPSKGILPSLCISPGTGFVLRVNDCIIALNSRSQVRNELHGSN